MARKTRKSSSKKSFNFDIFEDNLLSDFGSNFADDFDFSFDKLEKNTDFQSYSSSSSSSYSIGADGKINGSFVASEETNNNGKVKRKTIYGGAKDGKKFVSIPLEETFDARNLISNEKIANRILRPKKQTN